MYGPSFKYRDKRSNIIVNEAALCTSASLIFLAWHLHSFWVQTIERRRDRNVGGYATPLRRTCAVRGCIWLTKNSTGGMVHGLVDVFHGERGLHSERGSRQFTPRLSSACAAVDHRALSPELQLFCIIVPQKSTTNDHNDRPSRCQMQKSRLRSGPCLTLLIGRRS